MKVIGYLLAFASAFFVSYYTTPVAREAAVRCGVVDRPDGKLKNHDRVVPYFGGLAIYLAFLVGISLTFEFTAEVLAILLGGSIVVLVGLIDDLGRISPGAKLAGEGIAILVLLKSGVMVKVIYLGFPLQVAVTVFWMLLLTNAFNIIDIMDGLSAGIGGIGALFMFVVSVMNGNAPIAVLSAALAGALFGFLPHNFSPASIFMGDAGSLLVGYLLGAFSIMGKYMTKNHMGFIVPAVIFGIPLFDTLFVSWIRFMRGESIFRGSRDHFALRLRKWRLSVRQTVLVSYGAAIVCGLFGLGIMTSELRTASILLIVNSFLFIVVALWLKKIDMTL
ncbi:MAG: undecaprenyl/decaprenyl-phosphate alpha-N-acetylglucosaminyl 1-phosphate transferase [Deltaproteobacteria bacterium]|nr:MAG: undecaprenyl/decaprenyl-phosphate alpha-N-acetylglucosaminyl 1-phosphate transferase [Deltaproteobacteria bacterium]